MLEWFSNLELIDKLVIGLLIGVGWICYTTSTAMSRLGHVEKGLEKAVAEGKTTRQGIYTRLTDLDREVSFIKGKINGDHK